MKLTERQKKHLRGLAHSLKPLVSMGDKGMTDAFLQELNTTLDHHELIKVKLQEGCLSDRKEVAEELSQATKSAVAQILGKTILLYRPNKEQKIKLPKS